MAVAQNKIAIYLETGSKRTFASATNWPGWCRSGRDKDSALQAMLDYAPRYARVLRTSRLGFQVPGDIFAFNITERLKGGSTTDFGAPEASPKSDAQPVNDAELARLEKILKACWRAFDAAVTAAEGKELRTRPRGGGRDLDKIVHHVIEADKAYVSAVGYKYVYDDSKDVQAELTDVRKAIIEGLRASVRGENPALGPRGGKRWTPR